jgi:hypothetical protein
MIRRIVSGVSYSTEMTAEDRVYSAPVFHHQINFTTMEVPSFPDRETMEYYMELLLQLMIDVESGKEPVWDKIK